MNILWIAIGRVIHAFCAWLLVHTRGLQWACWTFVIAVCDIISEQEMGLMCLVLNAVSVTACTACACYNLKCSIPCICSTYFKIFSNVSQDDFKALIFSTRAFVQLHTAQYKSEHIHHYNHVSTRHHLRTYVCVYVSCYIHVAACHW